MAPQSRRTKIVYMGTPGFAVRPLKALVKMGEAGFDVVGVVTRPDKPSGRGRHMKPTEVKLAALENDLEVLEPTRLKDEKFLASLKALAPDLIVVVAYGKILPPAVLELPPLGCVNLHASILPRYRGASPINSAIINGDKKTGVTTMLMDEGMDTGPVLIVEETSIKDGETAGELSERLSVAGAALLEKTVALLADGKITPKAQDGSKATYAPLLKKEDGRVDWHKGPRAIDCLVRGTSPWPGAFTTWKGKVLKIHAGRAAGDGEAAGGDVGDSLPGTVPGMVVATTNEAIRVRCSEGCYDITELQMEGKRRLKAVDFLKGHNLLDELLH
jgi:methionyl-tRNA formyltransferase